jgi:hypothetical protein
MALVLLDLKTAPKEVGLEDQWSYLKSAKPRDLLVLNPASLRKLFPDLAHVTDDQFKDFKERFLFFDKNSDGAYNLELYLVWHFPALLYSSMLLPAQTARASNCWALTCHSYHFSFNTVPPFCEVEAMVQFVHTLVLCVNGPISR